MKATKTGIIYSVCMPQTIRQQLQADGFAIAPSIATGRNLELLQSLTWTLPEEKRARRGGIRDPFARIPRLVCAVVRTGVRALAADLFDRPSFIVRAILFDKDAVSNWSIPWHRDHAIAVASRPEEAELPPGFGPWSKRDGVHQTRPPRAILDAITTIRLHLDDTPLSNGPLRVIPGSHLSPDEADINPAAAVTLPVAAGDAVLMKPRTLHASERSRAATRRRVLHLELIDRDLPPPLHWHERVPLMA